MGLIDNKDSIYKRTSLHVNNTDGYEGCIHPIYREILMISTSTSHFTLSETVATIVKNILS